MLYIAEHKGRWGKWCMIFNLLTTNQHEEYPVCNFESGQLYTLPS